MTYKDIAKEVKKGEREERLDSAPRSYAGCMHTGPCNCWEKSTEPVKDENTTFNGYGNTSGGTATMLPTGKPQQECSEVCGAECTNMLHHPPAKVEAVEELRIQTHGKPGSLEDGLARIISKLNELVRVVNKMRQ